MSFAFACDSRTATFGTGDRATRRRASPPRSGFRDRSLRALRNGLGRFRSRSSSLSLLLTFPRKLRVTCDDETRTKLEFYSAKGQLFDVPYRIGSGLMRNLLLGLDKFSELPGRDFTGEPCENPSLFPPRCKTCPVPERTGLPFGLQNRRLFPLESTGPVLVPQTPPSVSEAAESPSPGRFRLKARLTDYARTGSLVEPP